MLAQFEVITRTRIAASSQDELVTLRKEYLERIIMITKWNFISAISSIEFSIKQFAKDKTAFSDLYNKRKKHVYLIAILERSARHNPPLLENNALNEWKCLLNVRNAVVHNNGVSEEDKDCSVSGIQIKFKRDEMLAGETSGFMKFSELVCELYSSWARMARQGCQLSASKIGPPLDSRRNG